MIFQEPGALPNSGKRLKYGTAEFERISVEMFVETIVPLLHEPYQDMRYF